VTPRWIAAVALAGALLFGAAPSYAAAPSPSPVATPPAPAECLSPNMICTYDDGAWVVEFKPPRPVDHVPAGFAYSLPVVLGVLGAFALLLGTVNAVSRLRRKRRMARGHRPCG